jgi:competence protein ComEC
MELLDDFPKVQIFDNPAPDRSALHRRLSRMLSELKKRGFKRSNLIAGDDLRLGRDLTAQVLFPPPGFAGSTADDQAFVIRLSIAPATFVLLMSDSGAETEQALLRNGLELHSSILIKGQHHSARSGSAAFLDAVRPQLIIATSQDFPEHERISEDWAEQVRARGIKLFRQDETGAVELKFRGNEWTARTYLTGEIFRSVSW